MLPFSRQVKWAKAMNKGNRVAKELLGNVAPLVALIATKVKLPGRLGVAVAYVLPLLADAMSELADGKLEELHEKAKAKHDFLTAVLTGFQLDLNDGVDQRILLSSNK